MAWYTQSTERQGELVYEGRLTRFCNRQAARDAAQCLVIGGRNKSRPTVTIFSGANQANLTVRERYWFDGELQRMEY